MSIAPVCPYCNSPAIFQASSADLYQGRDFGPVWRCRKDDAYVGCHKGTTQPLGRLANAALRRARAQAHAAFDPLWKSGQMTRTQAHALLASKLDIPRGLCHIANFDINQCRRVVQVLTQKVVIPL